MTDTQILTLAISIVIPLSMLLYSNSRVSEVSKRVDDAKSDLSKRMDDTKAELNQQMEALRKDVIQHIDNGFEHMTMLLKLHEAEHHKK